MKKHVNFNINDKVILLDGRIGKIVAQNQLNHYYYKVETNDGVGNPTYFKIFCDDMKPYENKYSVEVVK